MDNKIKINTHSSIRIEDGGKVFYFDPFKIEEKICDADFIFVTHDHYDHMDPISIDNVRKDETKFICPESIVRNLSSAVEIRDTSCIIQMKPYDKMKFSDDIEAEAIPAYNIGKPFHQKQFNWLGYILNVSGTKHYIAGDTDATDEASEISCDVALIPIGGTYTMDVNEAVKLVNTIKPKLAIPIHYGSIVGDKTLGKNFISLVDKNIEAREYINF